MIPNPEEERAEFKEKLGKLLSFYCYTDNMRTTEEALAEKVVKYIEKLQREYDKRESK